MKKILLVILLALCMTGCNDNTVNEDDNNTGNNACSLDSDCDAETADYLIAKNQITLEDLYKKIDNKESFVLYMYFDKCPWCKELGPVVSDYVKDNEKLLNMTYSFNVRPDGERDHDYRYTNDDGEFNYPEFKELYDYIYDFLDEDKKAYVPTLMFVKNGEIVYYHVGTVDSHDASERTMTDEEMTELEGYIKEYYSIYEED